MATWLALLRGINVGGKNVLPMAGLRMDLESLKFRNIRTYIQSGNVLFESPAKSPKSLAKKIASLIEERYGFCPQVLVLDHEDLVAAAEGNPFPKAAKDPKSLHFFFLSEPAKAADVESIANACAKSEKYELTNRVFYLAAPDGIGRSKLAANAEKYLGVNATARNFRTVGRLLELATK